MQVGVLLPNRETNYDPAPPYAQIRAFAEQAEQGGLDALWIFDHLLIRFPGKSDLGIWEAWTVLAAVAEATARVALGTFVACNAFRHPAVLAKMAATLDEVSGGRLVLGLGAGWVQSELDAFGLPSDHLVGRFEEALQIVRPLLRDGQVDFAGRFYQARDCVIRPRGPRPDGPPLLVGGTGPRMLRLTARYADAWNTYWFGRPNDEFRARRTALHAACAEVGRDPATLAVTLGTNVVYPDLGGVIPGSDDPAVALSGDTAAVAAGFRAFADAGVAGLVCNLKPSTPEALDRLAAAVRAFKRS